MRIIKKLLSEDKTTTKYLQETIDNHIIETGYYNIDEHIICISSQIGCQMNCIFCATTKPMDKYNSKRFIRNLTSEEIVKQVENILNIIPKEELDLKKILFSFAGMGEPFLNYDNVVESIKILTKKFPNSRTTVSTMGINPELMKKLARENISTELKLHFSLHAPDDILRKRILPYSKPIEQSLKALKEFASIKKTTPKVNYVLIKGINDSENHATQLAKLLKPFDFILKLSNLNNFNSLISSDRDKFDMFEDVLNSHNINNCRFFSKGTDIEAGCGQLRERHLDS